MLFNSPEFFGFLAVCLAGLLLLQSAGHRSLAPAWMLACSLFFYGWFKPVYLVILTGSIAVNYMIGRRIIQTNEAGAFRTSKILLAIGVTLNLATLAWYKYATFGAEVVDAALGIHWQLPQILLPIGISFFTFQQIAYLMDCRDGVAQKTDWLKYALFVTYFPQLIAGPIVHPNTLLEQFAKRDAFTLTFSRIINGSTLFILGLCKKVVLADAFGVWAAEAFNAAQQGHHLTFVEAWAGALCYTFQIYFDFSGYSDMAIGLALMIGIRLPINFDSPYKSTSIIEFWRRWHITLSKFLRDYLYIPLGGNRNGKIRRWRNLMLTMLLGGLWHGAGWNFIIWGGLHGLYLAANHLWIDLSKRMAWIPRGIGLPGRWIGWSLTMLAVVVGWVFFRAADPATAVSILKGMAGMNGISFPSELAGPLKGILPFVEAVPRLPHLAGGLRTGMAEVGGFLITGLIIVTLGKPLHSITPRTRCLLLIPAFSLTLQKILISSSPSEFLYFQF